MRRRYISDEELNQIIRLKQSGASWLKIQERTGVPRRSAKQAYEDWQRSQSIDELKAARVEVAAEEFRKHVEQLVDIAEALSTGLRVPWRPEETMKSDEFLNSIWSLRYFEIRFAKDYQQDKVRKERNRKRYMRECQMLLKSLQDHTREKVNWQLLEHWKEAWNDCIIHLSKLEQEKDMIADNITSTNINIIEDLNKRRGIDTAAKEIAQVVLSAIWQNIIDGKLDSENPEISMNYDLIDNALHITIERDLFKDIEKTLSSVAETFCYNKKEDIIQPLINDVINMNGIIGKLEEMLNPLVFRPLILRTRCELCPA